MTTSDMYGQQNNIGNQQQDQQYYDQSRMMNNNMQFFNDPNARFSQMSAAPNYYQPNCNQPSFGYIPYPNYGMPQQSQFQNNFSSGFAGNPYCNGFQQPINFFQPAPTPIPQDRTIHVNGVSMGGPVMFTSDAQDKLNHMMINYSVEQEEYMAKQSQAMGGYYSQPFFGGMYNSVYTKYANEVQQMMHGAEERRINFNRNLLKLCYNYKGEEISDEQLDMCCKGYNYTVTAQEIMNDNTCQRLINMVPVPERNIYAEHFFQLKKELETVMNMEGVNDFFEAQSIIRANDELAEEMHRRRDGKRLYNSDAYKTYLRKSMCERQGVQTIPGTNFAPNGPRKIDPVLFPTLSQCATVLDDGTLSIGPPPWLKGDGAGSKQNVINNQFENHFQENRNAFLNSIYNKHGG